MSNSKIRERLAAALPFRAVRQPKASESFFPNTYSWDSVTVAQSVVAGGSASTGGASSDASQVLQSTLKDASDAVKSANKQLTDLQAVQQELLATTGQNTQALQSNTAARGSSGSSGLSAIGNIASGIFGQGSILSPIATGLMSLFGAGHSAAPQPVFTPYMAPPSVQLQTTISSAAPVTPPQIPTTQSQGAGGATTSGAQVQIQVHAIDSKSFLDHSDEIANAVRQALLNSHSLGDVIAEM